MYLASVLGVARGLSQAPSESQDPLFPGMIWGAGKWPSFQFAQQFSIETRLYGPPTGSIGPASLYGLAFQYADRTLNACAYADGAGSGAGADAIGRYTEAVSAGAAGLDFVLYVPSGFGTRGGEPVVNVEETDDPEKVFTARFNGGAEVWPQSILA
jgi:hypothetical protein